ncbi:unnamed protein product [Amoebophrya sp. A25]|nr:unnamed protein product [Amoebophrya sp. A25]|eukprot:GSA25T00006780001.1
MDTLTLRSIRKAIEKEQKLNAKFADEAILRESLRPKSPDELMEIASAEEAERSRSPLRETSAVQWLSQNMRLVPDPYDVRYQPGSFTPEDLLYFGVSCEDQGRSAYLRKRKGTDWQDKKPFMTMRESQVVGWNLRSHVEKPSKFAHRPILENQFFRVNGVPLKMHGKTDM